MQQKDLLLPWFSLMENALSPFLVASQAVPVFAIAPLLVVWLGYGIGSKVLMAAVIGEWIGAQQGLGYLMIQANAGLNIDLVFAAILWLSVMGLSLWTFVGFLERKMITWKQAWHCFLNYNKSLFPW